MSKKLEPTPIKDVKPQLLCLGQLLGMDLYIDVRGEHPEKYDLAQKIYQRMLGQLDSLESE